MGLLRSLILLLEVILSLLKRFKSPDGPPGSLRGLSDPPKSYSETHKRKPGSSKSHSKSPNVLKSTLCIAFGLPVATPLLFMNKCLIK